MIISVALVLVSPSSVLNCSTAYDEADEVCVVKTDIHICFLIYVEKQIARYFSAR